MDIRAITIDLDDTLWPIGPVIAEAERHGYAWMDKHTPRVTARYTPEDLLEVRVRVFERYPQYAHDLSRLRKLAIQEVLHSCGYSGSMVELAFQEFFKKRNEVRLFPDALHALTALSRRYPIASVSNGNADLDRIGIAHLFAARISSSEVGVAKPHSDIFLAACRALGCTPAEVVHVGDHQVQDILGALRSGLQTIWLNRNGEDWQHAHRAHAEAEDLGDVAAMLA